MNVLSGEFFRTGLNNQRMCLMGLVAIAMRKGAAVRMPTDLFDFTPVPKGELHANPGSVPIWEIFDKVSFHELSGCWRVTEQSPTDVLSTTECFDAGKRELHRFEKRRDTNSFAAQFLRATPPSSHATAYASQILHWHVERAAITVQLRIERDWQVYLQKRNLASEAAHEADPAFILGKIRRTPGLDRFSAIWACCDEEDLIQPKAELKRIANSCGFDLLFKSDLPKDIALPSSRLRRSMIDFAVALAAPAYVGLTRSSFSKHVFLYSLCGMASPELYVYNTPDDYAVSPWPPRTTPKPDKQVYPPFGARTR